MTKLRHYKLEKKQEEINFGFSGIESHKQKGINFQFMENVF